MTQAVCRIPRKGIHFFLSFYDNNVERRSDSHRKEGGVDILSISNK